MVPKQSQLTPGPELTLNLRELFCFVLKAAAAGQGGGRAGQR